MTDAKEKTDPVVMRMQRLLSGPARPGQAFTMPGINYDGLYRMARRIRAALSGEGDAKAPVCMGTDDRTILAATMLATLADGPSLLIPDNFSENRITGLQRRTGFTRIITHPPAPLPTTVAVIDPKQLNDEAETLAPDEAPNPDRPWVALLTGESTGTPRLWSKTPRNLLGEVDYLIKRYEISSNDRILASVPALHIYGLLYSLLVPLAASARVVGQNPSLPEAIKGQMAATSPTIFVSMPVHYRALRENPPEKGALRLAFSSAGPLAEADGTAFSRATGVDLVEIYGSTETGGIAARRRSKGDVGFTPYHCIQWRVAGERLDVRSAFLSRELPVRSSGWFTLPDRVKTHGSDSFMVVGGADTIVEADGSREKRHQSKMSAAATGKISHNQQVTFEPAGLNVAIEEEQTLHELGAAHNIDIRADCGGMGICGKCRVLVHPKGNFSSPTQAELDVLTPDQMADGSRLACQARAIGRGTVTIPDTLAENSEARGKTGIAGSYPVDAMTRRLAVEGRSPGLKKDHIPESLLDWLAAQVDEVAASAADISSLRQLAKYRDSLKAFTLVVHEKTGLRRILAGRQTAGLGFAVDLGTTSVAGYLCNLETGALLAADACVNPQRRFGEDVISRISHINEKNAHLDQLQHLAAEAINFLMARCLEKVGATVGDIDEVGVCGNTTMQQVFAGLHPYGLGVFPYLPLTLSPPPFSAGDLGLVTDPAVAVFLMPVVSGFVGGDTMAAILADRPHERDEITLIVDIGTNGEVVLGNREGLWVTSCATGPALEGAQISCGMRAVSGAIHRAWPDKSSRRMDYEVLGNEGQNRPLGICGSGIIDAIAALRHIGAILPNGRLDETIDGVVSDKKGVGRHYTIAGSDQSATGSDISVTLKDVRQIQLAKGALITGIEFLMRKAGIEKVDRTILTGAFGARFNWKNALAIGMLPPVVSEGEVIPRENLAGVGIVMALLDKKLRSEAHTLSRRIRYLELASESDFAMAFAQATSFPEMAK
ncbi:ASKHA domain-containing protein [Desulfosarcina sp.]|uniref:ASKHA domain-containing protein n=1 Tax=Desulfosarcina sp. TaxID=2027861 RepID=UPI0035631335